MIDRENKHPGYQQLLKEAEEAEREDLEAEEEHEKSLGEKDDQEAQKNLVGPDHQELQNLNAKNKEKHPGFQKLLKDQELKELKKLKAKKNERHLGFHKPLPTDKFKEDSISSYVKEFLPKDKKLKAEKKDNHPGFQKLLADEELEELKKLQAVTEKKERHPGFQKLSKDEEFKELKKLKAEKKEKHPGFQTLLKDEERWVLEKERSEFLRHRSKHMSKAKYQPLDDMPDNNGRYRSETPHFAKGSFWHSMGKRDKKTKSDSDGEGIDMNGQVQNMASKEQDPRGLHDISRSIGHSFTREVSGVAGWGNQKQQDEGENQQDEAANTAVTSEDEGENQQDEAA